MLLFSDAIRRRQGACSRADIQYRQRKEQWRSGACSKFRSGYFLRRSADEAQNFDRGAAIGEFVGLITNGISGVDVMVGGTKGRTYQIYQGEMGNFTRFINHSCRPNSQFQRFYWRGQERIIVVSRGIVAGREITVDYSDHYWKQLNKVCLCGELCCRFRSNRQ